MATHIGSDNKVSPAKPKLDDRSSDGERDGESSSRQAFEALFYSDDREERVDTEEFGLENVGLPAPRPRQQKMESLEPDLVVQNDHGIPKSFVVSGPELFFEGKAEQLLKRQLNKQLQFRHRLVSAIGQFLVTHENLRQFFLTGTRERQGSVTQSDFLEWLKSKNNIHGDQEKAVKEEKGEPGIDKTRISRLVNSTRIELPNGEVIPLKECFSHEKKRKQSQILPFLKKYVESWRQAPESGHKSSRQIAKELKDLGISASDHTVKEAIESALTDEEKGLWREQTRRGRRKRKEYNLKK